MFFELKEKAQLNIFGKKTPYKYVIAMVTSSMMDKDLLYQIVSR